MRERKQKNRMSEIEAELYSLLMREQQRSDDYEKKKKDYETRLSDYETKLSDYEMKELKAELEVGEKAAKEIYPDLDIYKEMKNDIFLRLLASGIDVKTAYEVVHPEVVKAEKKAFVQKDDTDTIAPKKTVRPEENGRIGGGGAIFKSGVYALSKKDRAELAKRAQKGEIIRF